MEIPAPAGLYGMAIVEPAVLDRKLDGTFICLVELVRVFGMLCLNYTVIGLFLLQLGKMNARHGGRDFSGHLPLLELGCISLFEVRMFSEVRNGLSILALLWCAPRQAAASSSSAAPGRRQQLLAKVEAGLAKVEASTDSPRSNSLKSGASTQSGGRSWGGRSEEEDSQSGSRFRRWSKKGASLVSVFWVTSKQAAASAAIASASKLNRGLAKADTLSDSPKSGAVMVKEEEAQSGFRFRKPWSRRGDSDSDKRLWNLDGLSGRFRLWCTCVVGFPKLAIDLTLAYMGGVYILQSENDGSMLMNTLAVVFISEIEVMLYSAFTSDVMRQSLEGMRPVEVEMGNKGRLLMWFACSILGPVVTGFVALAVMHHIRPGSCPGFPLSWRLFSDAAQSLAGKSLHMSWGQIFHTPASSAA